MTGRTVDKFIKVQIEDAGGAMRDVFVDSINGVGINYPGVDVSALQDAIKKSFTGQGEFSMTLTGPLSDKAAATASATTEAPAETGSLNIFPALNGASVAKSFAVYFGIQRYWTAGDPVFGGIDTVLVSGFTVSGTKYSANIIYAGNAANVLAWGSSAITAS
jgi:hypothetical protein